MRKFGSSSIGFIVGTVHNIWINYLTAYLDELEWRADSRHPRYVSRDTNKNPIEMERVDFSENWLVKFPSDPEIREGPAISCS